MDGFEINKIAGAVLATALGVMGLGIMAEFIYEPIEAEEPGYVIAVATSGEEGVAEEAPAIEPIAARLQLASAEDGVSVAKKCAACHNFEQGAPNKTGPALWGVVGRDMASLDFNYSAALQDAAAEGRDWTFEELDHFLEAPKQWIPGTSMSFAGLKKPDDRAEVIAYLRTLSTDPVPLPEPEMAAMEEPAAEDATDATGESEDAPAEEAEAAPEVMAVEPVETPAETPAEEAPAAE